MAKSKYWNGTSWEVLGTDASKVTEETDKNFMTDAERTKLAGIQTGAQVNTVTSVASKTGAVVLVADDIGAGTLPGKVIGNNNTDYTKQLRNITLSTADPSGGSDGDVWIKYTP